MSKRTNSSGQSIENNYSWLGHGSVTVSGSGHEVTKNSPSVSNDDMANTAREAVQEHANLTSADEGKPNPSQNA